MKQSKTNLRQEYRRRGLSEADAGTDPIALFERWFSAAVTAEGFEPNAMALATATSDGRPSVRMVLLKGFGPDGFAFFTNYESRKGRELAANPWAAASFWWDKLARQVRIEGQVQKLTAAESDAYFHSRPLGARLGAWVSDQSSVISGRNVLVERLEALRAEYEDKEPPRPPYWGGYRLVPTRFEFWQGGEDRLHDRLAYTLTTDGTWQLQRLAP